MKPGVITTTGDQLTRTVLAAAIVVTLSSCVTITNTRNLATEAATENPLPSKPRSATSTHSVLDTSTGVALMFAIEPTPKTLDEAVASQRSAQTTEIITLPESGRKPSAHAGDQVLTLPQGKDQAIEQAEESAQRLPVQATLDPAHSKPDFYDSLLISGYSISQVDIPAKQLKPITSFARVATAASSVAIIGFTDRLGSRGTNEVIARTRAKRVEQGLVKQGLNASKIRVFECTTCFDSHNDTRSRRVLIVLSSTPPHDLSRKRLISFDALSRPQTIAMADYGDY